MTDEEHGISEAPKEPAAEPDSLTKARHDSHRALFLLILSLLLAIALAALAVMPEIAILLKPTAPEMAQQMEVYSRWSGQAATVIAALLMAIHWRLYRKGLRNLLHLAPDDNSLVAVSTLSAFLYSVIALALTDPDLIFGIPSTWYVPLGITLSISAWGRYILLRDRLTWRVDRFAADALPDFNPMPAPANSSLPGHVAILSLILALIAGIAWTLIDSVSVASAVFFAIPIAACPGALGITEALSTRIAIRRARSNGMILYGRTAIESAADTDTIVIGKSGLLTSGHPYITDVIPEGLTQQSFIGLAASAEAQSYHPIAEAIASHAIRSHVRLQRLAAFNELPGKGVETLISGTTVRVGTKEWLEEEKVLISANLLTKFDQLTEKGKTVLFVSKGREAKGLIAFLDDLRPESTSVLKTLQEMGIHPIMMTGENQRTAKAFSRQIDISDYKANLKAEDKMREIQLLQAHGKVVTLFADSSRDISAARQADLAVVPIAGAPEMKKIAAILLTAEGFNALPQGFTLCRYTMNSIRLNYIWAFAGPLLSLPAASGLLYAFGGPLFSPWMASLTALPGLIAAMINAFRLNRKSLN